VNRLLFLLILSLPACGLPWQDTVHTADELAVAFCHHWVAQNPDKGVSDAVCTLGGDVFDSIIALMDAKKAPADIKEALVAHPPLMSAAALAVPCIAPPPEPQSRIDRKLYPMRIVEPPAPGE
jgi:hypothetical protein